MQPACRVESLSQDGAYDSLAFIGKGGKPADVPLPVPVMRAVRVAADGRTTGPLLRNRAGNAPTTLDARRMVNRSAQTAGCRHITPHGLRRTFCMPAWSAASRRGTCRSPCATPIHTTGLYDMAKNNKDRHASHRVASFLAGMTG